MKRIFSIIFYIVIITFLITLLNNRDYKKYNINNFKTFNKYKDYKYVSLNLKEAKLNRLSLKNDKEYYIYSFKLGDKNLLIYLNKNTALTKKVNVIKYDDDKISKEIKTSLINDADKEISYYNGYYSNINYNKNKKFLNIKYYACIGIICVCVLLIIRELILLIRGKNE